jgi:membrane-associated phospholipid phosphatase
MNTTRSASLKDIWKMYGFWAFWVGVAFFSIYPTCNWLTSQRGSTLALYLDSELDVPLVPEFFWVYVSMYVLFLAPPFLLNLPQLRALGKQLVLATILSGVIFLLLPTHLGFGRVVPDDPFYGALYANLFTIDLPHNMVPSLHIVFSALILFSVIEASSTGLGKALGWGWLALICASTLLVHQHHLLDVAAGLLLALLTNRYIKKRESHV